MKLALCFLTLMTIAACAVRPTWTHPSLPKSQWSDDETECRHYADDLAMPYGGYAPPGSRASNPMQLVDQEEARDRFAAYFTSCMQGKGYRQAN